MVYSPDQDAHGQAMLDFLEGKEAFELIERDDGMIAPSGGPEAYFTEPDSWAQYAKDALEHVHGRVLDIGCGAGRLSLVLQERGHDVVAVDISPGAVETSKRRGVRDVREMSVTQVGPDLGTFDTIVMFGNNFGLFGSEKRTRWLLRRFHRLTTDSGRIVAESLNPYQTDEEIHLGYHERNRRRGRMGGQIRVRARYKNHRTPWFDYLLVSEEEMRGLLEGTGWRLEHVFDSGEGPYSVVIGKN
ncbi:MAG: methyltransferase domain-containing protein [Gemmatimonadetes bacterium]|nr:methyltransferase domain-containing protein [Gemmatimonadota bacterium]